MSDDDFTGRLYLLSLLQTFQQRLEYSLLLQL